MDKKRHLKKFENISVYESQKDEVMNKPHVVLLTNSKEVIYVPQRNKDYYVSQPFTLVALEDGTMNIAMSDNSTSMHYALNDNDWVEMTEAVSLTMNANDKVKIKAIGTDFGLGCSSFISSSMLFDAEGNIMSLLYGDDFKDKTSLKGLTHLCFSELFANTNIVSAKNLILPATTLVSYCYIGMFRNCTNLVEAPQLLAITLTEGCYSYMFEGCSKLTKITMLATDISAIGCLESWVAGVGSRGTFIKNAAMTTLPNGERGIPYDWDVENA